MHLKRSQGNHTEAIQLLERVLSIRVEKLGGGHPDTVSTRTDLEFVQQKVRPQLGRLVGKPRAPRVARKPGPAETYVVPCCRCQDEIEAAACDTGHRKTR